MICQLKTRPFATKLMIVFTVAFIQTTISNAQSFSFGPNGIEIEQSGKQLKVQQKSTTKKSKATRDSKRAVAKRNAKNFVITNKSAFYAQKTAETALKSGQLEFAAYAADFAVQKDPENGLLHLFASHVHFAAGNYKTAAAELDWATRNISATQWNIIIENIEQVDSRNNYASQQKRLAQYLYANPQSLEARVLFGFHAMANGRKNVAINEFSIVLESQPNYSLANRMRNTMGPPQHRDQAVTIRKGANNTLHIQSRSNSNSGVIQVNPNRQGGVIVESREKKSPSTMTPTQEEAFMRGFRNGVEKSVGEQN